MNAYEDIFLSHVSALACWAVVGHLGLSPRTLTPVQRPSTSVRNDGTIRQLKLLDSKFMSKLPTPLDIMVPSHERTFKSRIVTCHLCERDLPSGSLRRLTNHIYLASPELTFVQMGTLVTDVQLALVGMMLCGAYAIVPNRSRSLVKRAPLTTLHALRSFVGSAKGMHGVASARRALNMCAENARSPRESALFLLLCNAESGGGYELEQPDINRDVNLSPAAAAIVGTKKIAPDLCWYERGVVAEYDSWDMHNTSEKLADDDLRIQAFRKDHWEALTLRTQNVNDSGRFDRLVRGVLAPALGATPPELTTDFVRLRSHLRKEAMGFDPYVPSALSRLRLRQLRNERKAIEFGK